MQDETMAKAMTPMRGRQMLHMVYEWYKIDDGAGHMYSMEDLFSVTLKNDDLEAFKDHWDDVVSGFFEYPGEQAKRAWLKQELDKQKNKKNIASQDRDGGL